MAPALEKYFYFFELSFLKKESWFSFYMSWNTTG